MKDTSNATVKMPFWVLLAFSSIHKRKHAIILITASVLFTLYCLPWPKFIDSGLVTAVFLIDDWSWVAMMVPICLWYYLCFIDICRVCFSSLPRAFAASRLCFTSAAVLSA